MKSGIYAGAIAGGVMGIVGVISSYFFIGIGVLKLVGPPEMWDLPTLVLWGVVETMLGLIWGPIFGVIYKTVYNLIPSKGDMKGLYFGLTIWLIKDIAVGSYVAWYAPYISLGIILPSFFMWIAYGLVLGALYKK